MRDPSCSSFCVPPSVRRGLASLVHGNEVQFRSMLNLNPADDVVQALVDCMMISGLPSNPDAVHVSGFLLVAGCFPVEILNAYAARLDLQDQTGCFGIADLLADTWANPTFSAPSTEPLGEPAVEDMEIEEDALEALEELRQGLKELYTERASNGKMRIPGGLQEIQSQISDLRTAPSPPLNLSRRW